jgi:hypothetical protein
MLAPDPLVPNQIPALSGGREILFILNCFGFKQFMACLRGWSLKPFEPQWTQSNSAASKSSTAESLRHHSLNFDYSSRGPLVPGEAASRRCKFA